MARWISTIRAIECESMVACKIQGESGGSGVQRSDSEDFSFVAIRYFDDTNLNVWEKSRVSGPFGRGRSSLVIRWFNITRNNQRRKDLIIAYGGLGGNGFCSFGKKSDS